MKKKFPVLMTGLLIVGLAAQTQLAHAAAAAKVKPKVAVPAGTAHIRVLQATPGGSALKVDLNKKTVTDKLAAQTPSTYFAVPSGKCHIQLTGNNQAKLWNSTRAVKTDTYYTAVLYQANGKAALKLQNESTGVIAEGKARVYIYNLSSAGDLRITVASKRAKTGYTQWIKGVHPGAASAKTAAPGVFTLQARQGEKVLKELADFKVEKGQRHSVFILGNADALTFVTTNAGA